MNAKDYFMLYRLMLAEISKYAPNTDVAIVYHLGDNKNFRKLYSKYGKYKIDNILREMILDMDNNGIIKLTVAKPLIINSVTLLGYTILDELKEPSLFDKIKKNLVEITKSSLSEVLVKIITDSF